VPDSEDQPHRPAQFAAALDAIRHASPRAELIVTEIAAPGNLAPFAVALSADVTPVRHGSDSDFGTGRFILLYDPDEPESWGGPFRVVCFAQAPLETDIGVDPFLAEVAWAWLVDALDSGGANYAAASGTATKILSSGFGELAHQGDGAQIELRASWSPLDGNLAAHVEGWGELLCMLAGLPPASEAPRPPRLGHPTGASDRGRPEHGMGHGSSGPGIEAHGRSEHGRSEHGRPELGQQGHGHPAHGMPADSAGIPVGPLATIGPIPAPMRRKGPGLHTLGVAAGGLDSGGMETVGIDSIGLTTLGTPGAGRETVGMNTAGTNTVAEYITESGASPGPSIDGTSALNPTLSTAPAEPNLAAASDGGTSAGTARAPGLNAPGARTTGVTDLSAHRASRA